MTAPPGPGVRDEICGCHGRQGPRQVAPAPRWPSGWRRTYEDTSIPNRASSAEARLRTIVAGGRGTHSRQPAARLGQGGCRGRSLVEGNRPQHRVAPMVRSRSVRWSEFRRRYAAELHQHAAALNEICQMAKQRTVTLLFGAHDEEHNDAVVLQQFSFWVCSGFSWVSPASRFGCCWEAVSGRPWRWPGEGQRLQQFLPGGEYQVLGDGRESAEEPPPRTGLRFPYVSARSQTVWKAKASKLSTTSRAARFCFP